MVEAEGKVGVAAAEIDDEEFVWRKSGEVGGLVDESDELVDLLVFALAVSFDSAIGGHEADGLEERLIFLFGKGAGDFSIVG